MNRGINMSVEELRSLREMLQKRLEDFTKRKEERVQKMLADPTDRNIANQLSLIHSLDIEADRVWAVMNEIKFDIEDLTGEPEE